LILNIKSAAPIKHGRITKSEQVSAGRFHQEVKLASPDEVDALLLGWLQEAYTLSG
jgi:aspartate carbamoyltransferase catalytic subunit